MALLRKRYTFKLSHTTVSLLPALMYRAAVQGIILFKDILVGDNWLCVDVFSWGTFSLAEISAASTKVFLMSSKPCCNVLHSAKILKRPVIQILKDCCNL